MIEKQNNEKFPANAIRICIDQINQLDLSGRVYNKMTSEPLEFQNFKDLLLQTDHLFDEKGYPQMFQEKRSFQDFHRRRSYCGNPKIFLKDQMMAEKQGSCETFDVIITTRQKTGWQGILKCKEFSHPVFFESELGLIKSMVNAIRMKNAYPRSRFC